MQNDPGDTRLENYILEHSLQWLLRAPGHTEFWNPPIFHPVKNAAAYTDILLGAAPFYWLLRVLFAPDTSFQLWMLAMAGLNFGAFFLWLRRGLGFAATPATAGAFLFAFAGPRGAQASHPQFLTQFFSIAALHALTEIFKRPHHPTKSRLWIGVFMAACVLELYSAYYLGWLLFLGLLFAGVLALTRPRMRTKLIEVLRAQPGTWALALIASVAALYPMATHYIAAAGLVGYRPYSAVMPPRIHSWLYQGGGLYSWQNAIKAFHMLSYEQRQGIGWISWILAGTGLWRFRAKPWAWLALGTGAAAILLTSELAPGITAWRGLYYVIPGAKAIRALSRVALLVLIPAGLGLACFFQSRKLKPWALALLAIVIPLEQIQPTPSFDKFWMRKQVAHVARNVPKGCTSFYYVSILGKRPDYSYQLDAVWAGLELGLPTLNGFSGTAPPAWRTLSLNIANEEIAEVLLKAGAESWLTSQGDSSAFCFVAISDAFKDSLER
jgi:hypothetical protein